MLKYLKVFRVHAIFYVFFLDNWFFDNSIGEYAMCCNGTGTNYGRFSIL